ncbi:ribbon-helix-helix protein, CopG family [Bradyrhizobium sp. GCM10027634]|uniref:ribbon-helix-helix protein, CopG family n=1 Tax=unclassified Bradyrhizobium TaxID=2631580 RepID=UPI00263B19AF|nr:ribbon-helix-helix protein, CopG family [Bradyrhizobium sp. WYCCWR 12677]MDN5003814.1 ribbon-helix-helix protein, CopG family [Bradyrhizobium sp. WYCCWR 12677]
MAKTDKRLIGARVDEAFAERVEAAAEKEDRSLSSFVRRALAAAIEPKQRHGEAA